MGEHTLRLIFLSKT